MHATRLRSPDEIAELDAAARTLTRVLAGAIRRCEPGVATQAIERWVAEEIEAQGAEVLFDGYEHAGCRRPFEGSCCICINDEVVHGEAGSRVLEPGDLITVDAGLALVQERGRWCADSARSAAVGDGSEADASRARRLVEAADEAMNAAIRALTPGGWWSDAAVAAAETAGRAGFALVPDLGGHGIGAQLHEPPSAGFDGHFLEAGSRVDFRLWPGMVLTIEPIVCEQPKGTAETPPLVTDPAGWLTRTADGSWACHEERMVAITADGVRVLGLG